MIRSEVNAIVLRKVGKRFVSLQHKILIFTLILVLIPLLVVGILSYVKSSEIIRQKVSVSDLNTVTQIGQNLEFMFDYFNDTYLFMMQSNEVRHFLKMRTDIDPAIYNEQKSITEQLLTNLPNMKTFVHSIQLEGMNGNRLNVRGSVRLIKSERIAEILKNKGKPLWYLNEVELSDGTLKKVISYEREIKDINNISSALGVLQMNMDLEAVNRLLESRLSGDIDGFYLVNEDNAIVASTNSKHENQTISDLIGGPLAMGDLKGYLELKINRTPYLVTYDKIDPLEWHVLHIVPTRELLKENQIIPRIIIVTILITFSYARGWPICSPGKLFCRFESLAG